MAPTPRSGRAQLPHQTQAAPPTSRKQLFHRIFVLVSSMVLLWVIRIMKSESIDPVAYNLPEPHNLMGPLSPNEELKKAVKMAENKVLGPESIIVHEGNVYSGVVFGRIIKIDKSGAMSVFLQQGNGNCTTIWACGRPLGMRLDKSKKFFYVADAYYGLFKVNLQTAKAERVFPFDDNFRVTLFNDVDILPDGNLIVTESSVKWPLHKLMCDGMESASNGRLIFIDLKERKFDVVTIGLHFANGVQVDLRDGAKSVLVAETWRNRIVRVFVSGPRRGEVELFANLPGMPDNIRATEARDGYWVGLATVRAKEFPGNGDFLSGWPNVRWLAHKILPMPTIHNFMRSNYGMAIKLDLEGRIVGSLQDTNGSVIRDVAEVVEHDGNLYLGNYDTRFLARLDKGSFRLMS